jgi:hypothetical protein
MGIVVAAVAVIALLALLIGGGEDHEGVFGQDREGFEERTAQWLVAAPVGVDPAPVIVTTVEQERDRVSPEVATQLDEVHDLLISAAEQSPEQAAATLEQVREKLDAARGQVETAVDQAPNRVDKNRLRHLQRVLEGLQDSVQARLAGA